ncbi:hypothetical protein MKX01_023189 [Papaver californicum]|nr:hypothetical protein MKX01_023189 [Papaver californicum]
MSQQQPTRPESHEQNMGTAHLKEQPNLDSNQQKAPIKYGDVFPHVSGELASKPISPQDAAMMQTAENLVLGQTQKGGAAAVMQSAATKNEKAGLVGHTDVTDITGDQGVTVVETDAPGRRIISESVAGQVISEYSRPTPIAAATTSTIDKDAVTIGEALEAVAITAGDKPVDQSDAAAIQAAEVRATGIIATIPGGIAAEAQSAASANEGMTNDEEKTKLSDVLTDATSKLPKDKTVTSEDAEGVVSAELRNNPNMATYPGGIAASVAASARLNQEQ